MPSKLARYYDHFVNWDWRLAREIPVLEKPIPRKRVPVTGSGTGGYLLVMAAWK